MSLSKPNIQTVSSAWPDELIEAVLVSLLVRYEAYRATDGMWESPVVGSDRWKQAQAAFRLFKCCKRMHRMLGPVEDRSGNIRVPGRLEDLAHASAAVFAWTKVGEIAAHLDDAIKAATKVNSFAYQPECLRDYVTYRINDVGEKFMEGLDYSQSDIQQTRTGLEYTGCLTGEDTWHGDATSHVLRLQRNLDEIRADEEEQPAPSD